MVSFTFICYNTIYISNIKLWTLSNAGTCYVCMNNHNLTSQSRGDYPTPT